ncbi:ribose-5-phosphate isomerase RpiA [Paroceanicella profunda]|uniref:Ribose-5-phosphate isomerase A n=1 Tax=Paroceanicella profunda TaxID=2579971 RepID=A0A5B8G0Z7_9RHOB|nr:ribose-5-phosphate isomerase RpiA [Paroceanicella profunda]QDL92829.1 ribose-5-phosphate isomerase RpiA [Paroceanicella profunda]
MSRELSPPDRAKFLAARQALTFVEDGMRLGLGTGSTAAWFHRLLAERIHREGLNVIGVPTSSRTRDLCNALGVPLTTLDDAGWLDLTIDGADELDESLTLIKGGGGALLLEKIVATASDRMLVIADGAKRVKTLGAFPLPVEIVPFGWKTTKAIVEEALADLDVDGRNSTLRLHNSEPFVTDEGHFIIDLHLGRIGDATALAHLLTDIPGVVETGLFIGIAQAAVIGEPGGTVIRMTLHEEDRVIAPPAPEEEQDLIGRLED